MPKKLPLPLGFCIRFLFVLLGDRNICRKKSPPYILNKRKDTFEFFFIAFQMIEKKSADAARFIPVFNIKIFVAPFFESGIVGNVMLIARKFYGPVKVNRVF